jgi:hypothetical protein
MMKIKKLLTRTHEGKKKFWAQKNRLKKLFTTGLADLRYPTPVLVGQEVLFVK